jgi:hypothetical protein
VYGSNTNSSGGYGVYGDGYTGVYGVGNQYGVQGVVIGADDSGVYGVNGNSSSGYGVYGDGYTGVYGTGDWYGVHGEGFYGVYGHSATDSGVAGYGAYSGVHGEGFVGVDGAGDLIGVQGSATGGSEGKGVSGSAYTGVYGYGDQYGVHGVVALGDRGVYGENESVISGYGVYGEGHTGTYGTGDQYGVHGHVEGADDRGVFGESTNASSGYGVYGEGHTGVYGSGDDKGVHGEGYTGVYGTGDGKGVYGEGPTGVYGTGEVSGVQGEVSAGGATGVLGCNHSDSGFGTVGWNLGGVGVGAWSLTGHLIEAYSGEYPDGELRFRVDPDGNVYAANFYTLTSSPAADESGVRWAVPAIQSPEAWMEDFGTASLVDGQAVVSLEPVFAGLVNLEAGYHVYLTPLGDCQGLYVADKTAASFEVRELGGGKANVSFDYRIVARQAGYEGVRLAEVVIESAAQPEGRPSPEGGAHE